LWKKKPNNQKPVFETAKERKSERERERKRGEVKQRRKSLASLTTLSPSVLCLPSSLKATKRFESGRRRRRSS